MEKIIGLDSSIFIYLLEEHPRFLESAKRILTEVQEGGYEAVFSSIGMIEVLTGPKKLKQYDLASRYRELLKHFPHLTIIGMNENIIELASDLRARYGITTPDAIHLASSIDFGATRFITNDQSLKKVKEIEVQTLEK